ncbi:hypothetical protein SBA5_880010 [Candidatus Sulfotelmatomonas gaucii]|uniref:Uncharacterized protein n=1 Tax=Candidatus Sulfuritelmatomonas gaucii TaxID=2043161 RepID=A0A2N9M7C6_9BACT|nr:hypothetical protein SBA5_880010 [Candidatus Sulfotelmatomonas gaucii]
MMPSTKPAPTICTFFHEYSSRCGDCDKAAAAQSRRKIASVWNCLITNSISSRATYGNSTAMAAPEYSTLLNSTGVEGKPAACVLLTRTTRNVRLRNMPLNPPLRSPIVSV